MPASGTGGAPRLTNGESVAVGEAGDTRRSSRAGTVLVMATARPHRILIVDDNGVLRALLAQALESAGYVAIGADSGEAALEVVRFDPPDLCVVDQVMPGMSGVELVRALRTSEDEQLRRMPVIGLTGLSGAERLLLEAGADAALPKPFGEGPLLEMVERTLAER